MDSDQDKKKDYQPLLSFKSQVTFHNNTFFYFLIITKLKIKYTLFFKHPVLMISTLYRERLKKVNDGALRDTVIKIITKKTLGSKMYQ